MNINYEYYKIFYYVAKYQSFTAAAKVLLNNQPNITRTIKKLETELGCHLFIRQKNGVILTPEGEKLYHHVSTAVEHIIAGENEIARDRSLTTGTITIAASEIALHCTLIPVLNQFRKDYPTVHIKVLNHTTPQAIDILRKGLADFAVVTTPLGSVKSFITVSLRKIQEIPVCSNAFPLNGNTIYTWNELSKYPIIGLGNGSNSYLFYSSFFADHNITYNPDIEVSTADQILPLIYNNFGIGFIPTDFLQTNPQAEGLTVLQTTSSIPQREICLIKQPDYTLNIAAQELEKMLLQSLK